MTRFRLFPCIALALALLLPASAAGGDGTWQLRAGAAWLEVDAVLETSVFDLGSLRATASGDLGLGFGLEYRFSPRLGVELGVLSAAPELDPDPSRLIIAIFPPPPIPVLEPTSLRVTPITLGLNVHLSPGKRVDVYGGPLLAWVAYGDLSVTGSFATVEGDLIIGPLTRNLGVPDDFAVGGKLGVDVRLGDGPWSATAAATYVATRLGVQDVPVPTPSVGFDPIFLSLGLGYRF